MKITKNYLRQLIKEAIFQSGSEKTSITDAQAQELADIFKFRWDAKIKARKFNEKYYNFRRTTGASKTTEKSISFSGKQDQIIAQVQPSITEYTLSYPRNSETSWVAFNLLHVDNTEKKVPSEKKSVYVTVGYKPNFKSASDAQIINDWKNILKNIFIYFNNSIDMDLIQLKFHNDVASFEGDPDNLKIYFYTEAKVSYSFINSIPNNIKNIINSSLYFSSGDRSLPTFAIERSGSYGQTASAYVSTFVVDALNTVDKVSITPQKIKDLIQQANKTINPETIVNTFKDPYGILK